MFDNDKPKGRVFELADAARTFAGLDDSGGPWWATLDSATWRPMVAGGDGPERGGARAMLVAASLAGYLYHGPAHLWQRVDPAPGDTPTHLALARLPDGTLLAPLEDHAGLQEAVPKARPVVSRLIALNDANVTWTSGDAAVFACHRRHQVSVPASRDFGSKDRDLAALLIVLSWELTMRRGSPRNPAELVCGLACAFALSSLGFDPSVGSKARVRIERPRCLDDIRWQDAGRDDAGLLLGCADEAELVADEILLPVTGGRHKAKGKVEGETSMHGGYAGSPHREAAEAGGHVRNCGNDDTGGTAQGQGHGRDAATSHHPLSATYSLDSVAASAKAASRALSRHGRRMRAW